MLREGSKTPPKSRVDGKRMFFPFNGGWTTFTKKYSGGSIFGGTGGGRHTLFIRDGRRRDKLKGVILIYFYFV